MDSDRNIDLPTDVLSYIISILPWIDTATVNTSLLSSHLRYAWRGTRVLSFVQEKDNGRTVQQFYVMVDGCIRMFHGD